MTTLQAVLIRPMRAWYPRAGKRAIDLTLAGLAMLILSPVFAIIWLAVTLSSRGPALFRQERVGRNREPFMVLKFRTMYTDNDDAIHRAFVTQMLTSDLPEQGGEGGLFKLEHDPRITPVGRWLRRTSLDELPQLLNIIRGDMSLVGPRPPIAYEIENYQPWHMERLKAVPGLTGLWQISGRSSVSFDEMVRLDIRYINEWSFRRDLAIIAKTVPVVFRGTGGY